jgi:hypothetical protein
MTLRAAPRLVRWWSVAEGVAAGLTAPGADVDGRDRDVARLLRSSRLAAAASGVAAAAARAWRGARIRRAACRAISVWAALPPAARIRMAGWAVAVAGATAWLAQWTKPMPVGPLSWLVPIAAAALGALAAAAAHPFARWLKAAGGS